MKHLLLLRHAKSSWKDASRSDKERPLNKRGTKDAERIGQFLSNTNYIPDTIFCSTARRTRQTLSLLSDKWKDEPEPHVVLEERLYSESVINYLKTIQQAPSSNNCVMVIGHNPNMEQLACHLLSSENVGFIQIPTGGLICIKFAATNWHSLGDYGGQLKWMIIPKVLKKLQM